MDRDYSDSLRNALNDTYESHIGPNPVLKYFTGPKPANCAAANTGVELISFNLPSDWAAPSALGVKVKAGTWESAAIANGQAGHYRMYASNGTTCHEQGDISTLAGDGALKLASVDMVQGQTNTVTAWTNTAPGG